MKFKIFSKTKEQKEIYHYFDNISLDIFTDQGIPVLLRQDPRCRTLIRDFNNHEEKVKDKNKIREIRVTLGFACNFHCRYCIEHQIYETKKHQEVIPVHEDVQSKAERLVNQIVNNFPNLETLTFWGGEPFVYFKLMRKMVELLKKKLPKLRLYTISNGSLLNDKIADWIIENNIGITFSHDGPSFKVYRDDEDPLDNPVSKNAIIRLIKHFKKQQEDHVRFNIVVTPENADLQKIIPFFEQKLGFIPEIQFESIVKTDERTDKIIHPFTEETKKILLNNMVAYGATPTDDHDYHGIRAFVSRVLQYLINQHLPDLCCMLTSPSFAAFDANGNTMVCHANAKTYCQLEDIDKVEFPEVNSWSKREACKQCPLLVACLGACPCISQKDQEIQCKNLKIWASGLFIAAWKLLFDATIYRIEPCSEEEWNDHIIG